MENHFVRVSDPTVLAELTARSNETPIVIFKHSTTCQISSAAYSEMTRVLGDVALVEVQHARELSREIEVRTGIEHKSPQVIILRNGQAVWHASHWKIKAEAVEQAVLEAA
jgi:bacillithiol system protein YtxJ